MTPPIDRTNNEDDKRAGIRGSSILNGQLSYADAQRVESEFGVSYQQVLRDHAISHLLAVLSLRHADELIFFGGTALSRTHLRAARLSEDIDLIAIGDRNDVAQRISRTIENGLRRTIGRVEWVTPLDLNRDVTPGIVQMRHHDTVVNINIQLLASAGYEPWPTEIAAIYQRYADAPPATLRVPTRASFIGWKTAAWMDRSTPRDLYDLWAIAAELPYPTEAVQLFVKHGPIHARPQPWMFTRAPTAKQWRSQLAGQTKLRVQPAEALDAVRSAWADALGEDWGPLGRVPLG